MQAGIGVGVIGGGVLGGWVAASLLFIFPYDVFSGLVERSKHLLNISGILVRRLKNNRFKSSKVL